MDAAASQLVEAILLLQAAIAASDEECIDVQMIVIKLRVMAPIIKNLERIARHFDDRGLSRGVDVTLQPATCAIQLATLVVYKWLVKPSLARIESPPHFQPALRRARRIFDAQMFLIRAFQNQQTHSRLEEMPQLDYTYEDISQIFKGLLAGTQLDISRDYTIILARAQLKQASRYGQALGWDYINTVAWSPDGCRMATGGKTGAIWDPAIGVCLRVLEGHTFPEHINSIAWSLDSARVATASCDKSCLIWLAATGERQRALLGHTSLVSSVAWSPDGSRVATGSGDKTGGIWDAGTGECLRVLRGHTAMLSSISWSPDGSMVVTASHDGRGATWDAITGECLQVLKGHCSGLCSIAWSPDGSRVATASWDGLGAIWHVGTGKNLKVLAGHTSMLTSIAWSPNGSTVATSSADKTGAIWDVATGKRLWVLEGHTDMVMSIVWSPKTSLVATASADATGAIWDAFTGQRLRGLEGHASPLRSVAWCPAGSRVSSVSKDNTARCNGWTS
jgi:dipeptidyl aminopeptidase/acylaminoacyl peptidase